MRSDHRSQRVRDSVHGLIVFTHEGRDARRDQTAWRLLNTPEFQRLRRIRQLGLSEITFPGATHTRFSHSIGVFHTARMLVRILSRLIPAREFNRDRADLAVLAALVHDLGHGPFSHTFESVQKARGSEKHHEAWTAEIILDQKGKIRPILEHFREGITEHIAELLTAEEPRDLYHAVVSSSFDADRLDYLRRDRLMTGTGAGAIDFDWLLDNLRIAQIRRGGDDDVDSEVVQTFCLDEKALQPAEVFLLARYHLYEQVYLHKTTRGMEAMLRSLLTDVAETATNGAFGRLGLDESDPLIRFFGNQGDTVRNYMALDDFAVWAAIGRIASGEDDKAWDLARRLRDRRLYKALDINTDFPVSRGESLEATEERRQREILRLEELLRPEIGKTVLMDEGEISIYGEIGADQAKTHKMLSIRLRDGTTREITELSPLIRALGKKRAVVRFYFSDDATRDRARVGRGR
jgi:HD superfamily phosphohydrolase